jgi:hypothetical protein
MTTSSVLKVARTLVDLAGAEKIESDRSSGTTLHEHSRGERDEERWQGRSEHRKRLAEGRHSVLSVEQFWESRRRTDFILSKRPANLLRWFALTVAQTEKPVKRPDGKALISWPGDNRAFLNYEDLFHGDLRDGDGQRGVAGAGGRA